MQITGELPWWSCSAIARQLCTAACALGLGKNVDSPLIQQWAAQPRQSILDLRYWFPRLPRPAYPVGTKRQLQTSPRGSLYPSINNFLGNLAQAFPPLHHSTFYQPSTSANTDCIFSAPIILLRIFQRGHTKHHILGDHMFVGYRDIASTL